MIQVDNRQVAIVHVFAPLETVYDEFEGNTVDRYADDTFEIKLVFDDGGELVVDYLAMYGTLDDNRGSRPLAYVYEGNYYLTETRQDVKFQVMR